MSLFTKFDLLDPQLLLSKLERMFGATDGVTADVAGTKADATQLGYGTSRVTTAGKGGTDAVLAPSAVYGARFSVIADAGGNAFKLFGGGTNTIDGVATTDATTVADGTVVSYECLAVGEWRKVSEVAGA